MKRFGNLYPQICSLENLRQADALAQKGKSKQKGVVSHNRNSEANILALHESLLNKTFRTSRYSIFKVYEPKEREIYKLPFYPDRILHHALINVIGPILVSTFTADTYSCIKGRGIHLALRKLRNALNDREGTKYCLKLDIRKFYPSVNHDVLKALLRRKFKDPDLLWLLDEIIDSIPGLPIGNLPSQYFANFYLTGFDHWVKEVKGVNNYFRYLDDIVVLSDNKESLHKLLSEFRQYLDHNLKLTVKGNYQVFPVEARGIDFLGYVSFHDYALLRKRNKKSLVKAVRAKKNIRSIASYKGWAKHCNSKNLIRKYLKTA